MSNPPSPSPIEMERREKSSSKDLDDQKVPLQKTSTNRKKKKKKRRYLSEEEAEVQSSCLPRCLGGSGPFIDTMGHTRRIRLNDPPANQSSLHQFVSNTISTSKYTLLNFLPKNLYEQFQKVANAYFLVVAIVVSIPGISTIEPYTSVLPLVFVLSVTAIREAYEDFQRHKSDKETNGRKTLAVRGAGQLVEIEWSDVRVGDVLKVRDGEEIAADMLLLSSSDEKGIANIMTANLDGETNLKPRLCLQGTQNIQTPSGIADIRGIAVCEPPNPDLMSFEASYQDEETQQVVTVTSDQMLLRGARLMDTEYAFGLVVYTGWHTKLMLNANEPRHKRSRVEWTMNTQIYWIFAMQFVMITFLAIMSAFWYSDNAEKHWYLSETTDTSSTVKIGLRNFAAYFILLNVMVPISLYVSMELVKVFQSVIIWWDIQMYDPISDTRAIARTSNLNEELGQIGFVFADKTGTLTQNKMSFYKCAVNGKKYGQDVEAGELRDERDVEEFVRRTSTHRAKDSNVSAAMEDKMGSFAKFVDPQFGKDLRARGAQATALREFGVCLGVCHTVDVVDETAHHDDIEYRGVSIDEVALVIAANDLGFKFLGRNRQALSLQVPGERETHTYEILNVIDFTSDRKRMSVVARLPSGQLRLYSKGADSTMLERMSRQNNHMMIEQTKDHLEEFSRAGLRTLVVGYRDIDEDTYAEWAAKYKAASESFGDRANEMEKVANQIEQDLMVIGVTAIEDALQIGVEQTLQRLRRASIKVWMLTGDKQGTAVNIGKSCGLIDPTHAIKYIHSLDAAAMTEELQALLAELDAKHTANRSAEADAGGDVRVQVVVEDLDGDGGDKHDDVDSSSEEDGSGGGDSDDDERKESRRRRRKVPASQELFKGGVALVVDGPNLKVAMGERDLFFKVINHPGTKVVICSRMAPRQKASVVQLVKDNLDVITLAVGDGANDVSMIQSAHVGIGVRGKEGLQAVNSSDYAISQFRFLARLLLVHGRLSYKRNTKLILYSFYKSMVISWTQFYFSIFSAWSTQELYDGLLLNTFNLFFASLPIIALAVFDRDLEIEELMEHPEIYTSGIVGSGFNNRVYWSWIWTGIWHAVWVFFIPWFALQHLGLWAQSMATYGCLLIAVTFKIAVLTRTWTAWNFFVVIFSLVLWLAFGFGLSSESAFELFPNLFGVFPKVFSDANFWLAQLFVAWMAMWQDYLYKWWRHEMAPPSLKLMLQNKRREQQQKKTD